MSWDGSVNLFTELTGWASGVPFMAGAESFCLRHRIQTGSGAHPASYSMGTEALFSGVKRPGREADHLQLVPRLIMYGTIPSLINTSSWYGA
jgi:hypothetical protein